MTTEAEHLLFCWAEECAEVQKHACKAGRFGLDDRDPTVQDAPPERDLIHYELNDLYAVVEMLHERGLVDMTPNRAMREAKKRKVLKYLDYARMAWALA